MGKGTAGKEAELTVDDGGGHVSVATTNVPINDTKDTVETTEQTDDVESMKNTIRRVGLPVEGIYRPGTGTGQDAGQEDLEDAYDDDTELEVKYYPQGNASGNTVLTFNAICTQFNIDPGGPTGVTTFSAQLQISDGTAPTRGTVT